MKEEDPGSTIQGLGPRFRTPPKQIDQYRILQKLGEGGMGVVYEAEQVEPVRRKVALKVIKRGMDSEQVVHRFESERQALALMNHPNIAGVLDAGVTDDGRPYFAMEFVRGVPITDYCNHNRLDTEDRLRLFIDVCEAVQHAHQKSIIHRDIKPSNVLVRHQDGKHVPKIIDFGVAKATAQRLTEETFFTEMGQLIGTPEYMSPEQAEMAGLDIDTRTDVYLLGVLLYELLTGELPFPKGQLREVGLNEFRRIVVEDEPPKPSTRVTHTQQNAKELAQSRRTELPALSRMLKGDLDWITMKALDKDRARRYPSASEFARDVERHLKNEPVVAGPPSRLYRMGKFVRRHKTGVSFAVVLVVLLATLAVNMAVQRNHIAVERDRANAARNTAERVVDYLVDLFRFANPHENLGDTVTARQLLDRGTQSIAELEEEPLVRARLLDAMGSAYAGIGLRDRAVPLLNEALSLHRQADAESLEVAESLISVADVIRHRDFKTAQEHYELALRIRREHLPEDDPAVVANLERVGIILAEQGDYRGAEEYLRQVFEIRERKLGPNHPDLAVSLSNRAALLKRNGKYEDAELLLLRALAIRQSHPDTTPSEVAFSHDLLGNLYNVMTRHEKAREQHRLALEIRRGIFHDQPHPQIASNLASLAIDNLALGQTAEAEKLYAEAMEIYHATDSLDVPFELHKAADYAALTGDRNRALSHLRRAFVEKGYSNARTLLSDAHLRALHGDSEFEAIVAAVKRRTGER